MRVRLLIIFFSVFSAFAADATHIVGGELNYRQLGNDDYEISLTVYRDCFNGVPLFDNPASVGIYDANNILITSLLMPFLGLDTISNEINSACFIPPTNVCYEVTTYIDTINLPPIPGGYQLAYQRCCRNQTIQNIINPNMTGATFYAYIPGPNVAAVNSNPVFNIWPPPFVCQNLPWVFDHSATDIDGDSLAYELCVPFDGATPNNPMPQPPFNPPYNNVQWNLPYNLNNVLGGVPLTINPNTGLLTATPNSIGQFVVGVCVKEYRNGLLISQTKRDFQVNVLPCPNLIVAAIQSPLLVCGSNTVSFLNQSIGAATFYWDFGVDSTLADTSILVQPTFTFPDTGLYTVTLIAFSGVNPGCADTTRNDILILPPYEAEFNYSVIPCTHQIQFTDTVTSGSFDITNSWLWNFGDNGSASIKDPVHTYNSSGIYNVSLIGTSIRGCVDTILKQVVVPELVSVTASTTIDASCSDSCDAVATALASGDNVPIQFLWSDPAVQNTATATALCAGMYTVTATDNSGCTSLDTILVTAPPPLSLGLTSTDAYCRGKCIGTTTANTGGGTSPYSVVWNDPLMQSGNSANKLCPGLYTATITDSHGCKIIDSVEVMSTNDLPEVLATVDDSIIFKGDETTLHATNNQGYSFLWTPTNFVSNPQSSDPTTAPVVTTTYIVLITDSNNCVNSDTVTVVVRVALCDEPEIFVPTAFTPNGDNNNDLLFVRGNAIKEMEFSVYDRWGEKVFESNDPKIAWDGTFRGKDVMPGVFVYHLKAVCFGDSEFVKKGNITVIR